MNGRSRIFVIGCATILFGLVSEKLLSVWAARSIATDLCAWLSGRSASLESRGYGPAGKSIIEQIRARKPKRVECEPVTSPHAQSFWFESAIEVYEDGRFVVGFSVSHGFYGPTVFGCWQSR